MFVFVVLLFFKGNMPMSALRDLYMYKPIYDFNFNLIPPRVHQIKDIDRQTGRTDGQQSDPIRVPFFLLGYGTIKRKKSMVLYVQGLG